MPLKRYLAAVWAKNMTCPDIGSYRPLFLANPRNRYRGIWAKMPTRQPDSV